MSAITCRPHLGLRTASGVRGSRSMTDRQIVHILGNYCQRDGMDGVSAWGNNDYDATIFLLQRWLLNCCQHARARPGLSTAILLHFASAGSRFSILRWGSDARSYVLFILFSFLPARIICYRLLHCAFADVLWTLDFGSGEILRLRFLYHVVSGAYRWAKYIGIGPTPFDLILGSWTTPMNSIRLCKICALTEIPAMSRLGRYQDTMLSGLPQSQPLHSE